MLLYLKMREKLPLYKDLEIHENFLETWNLERLRTLPLEEYVSCDDNTTFVWNVEIGTKVLGSIRGASSYKFGIYKRKANKEGYAKVVYSNDIYSWIKYYDKCNFDHYKVYEKVRKELIRLVEASQNQDFEAVESIEGFYDSFKWKVAFLYSKGGIIPIFSSKPLRSFVKEHGFPVSRKVEYAKWHRFLFDNKPKNTTVYNFMRELFDRYDFHNKETQQKNDDSNRRTRLGTHKIGKKTGKKRGTSETTFYREHEDLKEKLMRYLGEKYESPVELVYEQNYIDLLLRTREEVHYYEVKTGRPVYCVREGLGQVLSYEYFDRIDYPEYNEHLKKVIIFGKERADKDCLDLVQYIKTKLDIEFEYLSLEEICRAQ
jgi:hypothetical protein